MKSYTDLEQSKKLAEILPLESADMHFTNSSIKGELYVDQFKAVCSSYSRAKDSLDAYAKIVNNTIAWEVIPCWSLAALIEAMPEILIETVKARDGYDGYYYFVTYEEEIGVPYEKELIDACYEMIVRLHEQKLL